MKKRNLLIITIITILLAGLGYIILSASTNEQYEEIDTLIGVPINSELIIHLPNIVDFIENSENEGVWQELSQWESIGALKNIGDSLKEILSKTELSELSKDSQLTIATKVTGRDQVQLSFIFPLKRSNNKNYITKFISYSFKNFTDKSRKYSGFELHHLKNEKERKDYYYTFAKGLFIFSTSHILVEDALLQISNKNSLLDDKAFEKLQKIASANDDMNIYINGNNFPKLLALMSNSKYRQFIKELSDFTTRAGIDVSIQEDKILMNGFLFSNTDDFYYTNILLNQEPVQNTIEEIIPDNANFWATLALSNEEAYLDNYKRYLEQTGDIRAYRDFATHFKTQSGQSPENLIYPIIDKEIGLVISGENILGEKANRYAILKTKSRSETAKRLTDFILSYNKTQNTEQKSYQYKIDENLSYNIQTFPFPKFANMMWGGLFYETETNYFTLIDNYIVFGASQKSLERYIDFIIRRKTLIHSDFYKEQKRYRVDNKSSFSAYLVLQEGKILKEYADERLNVNLEEKKEDLAKFSTIGLQIKAIKEMLYLNAYVSYNPVKDAAPETVWQSRIDNPMRMKPTMVKNFKTGEQELILQDTQNILYLISNGGRILWKLPLEEPILGRIYQVDAYKNGKLQYLFNTKSKLYLIDKNGNKVDRFPVSFRSPATNSIAVFDYDKSRNYRIFIASENKQTYLYDIKGNLVEGWNAAKNEHLVTDEIHHIVNNSKDYIIYNDGYRNYILSRRGDIRVLPQQNFKKAKGSKLSIAEQTNKQPFQVIATDTIGTIYKTFLNKTVEVVKVGKFTNQHQFLSEDLDGDGANDYIFTDGNELSVFAGNGQKMFRYEFDSNDLGSPNIYTFSKNNKKIGIRAGNSIYLFNSSGSIYKGFPVEGYSDFSIGFISPEDKQFNLFVGGVNNLLYNYRVQ